MLNSFYSLPDSKIKITTLKSSNKNTIKREMNAAAALAWHLGVNSTECEISFGYEYDKAIPIKHLLLINVFSSTLHLRKLSNDLQIAVAIKTKEPKSFTKKTLNQMGNIISH